MRALFLAFLAGCGGAAAVDPVRRAHRVPVGDGGRRRGPGARSGAFGRGLRRGYTAGTLRVSNIGPVGDSRGFVRKLSAAGAVQWETALQTEQTDVVEALAHAPDGRLYAAGRTTVAGTPSCSPSGCRASRAA